VMYKHPSGTQEVEVEWHEKLGGYGRCGEMKFGEERRTTSTLF
jgi:hypothetical protein